MDKQETIADIIAMLRANARGDRFDCFSFTSLADRLEAAHKREAVTDCNQLRDALMNLDKWLFVGVDGYVHGQPDKTVEIELTIKEALAATVTTSIQNTQED